MIVLDIDSKAKSHETVRNNDTDVMMRIGSNITDEILLKSYQNRFQNPFNSVHFYHIPSNIRLNSGQNPPKRSLKMAQIEQIMCRYGSNLAGTRCAQN